MKRSRYTETQIIVIVNEVDAGMKEMEQELSRCERMYAELAHESFALKDIIGRKL